MRGSPLGVVLATALLLAAGCGGTKTVTVTTTQTVLRTVTTPVQTTAVRVYFNRDGKVAPVARRLSSTSAEALLDAYLAGPTDQERRSGFSIATGTGGANLAPIVYTLSQFAPTKPVE
jgi:type IV pilus biogenesis protein CpaD/CtpE